MQRRLLRMCWPVIFGVAASSAGQTTVNRPIPGTTNVRVDASRATGAAIPDTVFGTFLEPIGHSTYGGLWAELLVNPSLEENLWSTENIETLVHDRPALAQASSLGLPLPWEPLDVKEGNRYEPRWGDAANSSRSLLVMGVPGQETGIRQQVFLPVHRILRYHGSLYARHVSGATGLRLELRQSGGGAVLASATVAADKTEWTRYEFDLTVPATRLHRLESADFAVVVEGEERVLLDQLSLMPADAADGLDPDVVAMAKAMETPLLRFGGNYTSSYHWRDGVGPRDRRVSMLNVAWGIPEYNTFGTDEFLRFCEQIGAEPQVALNLGSGTPEEAAGWVRYINEQWHQHSGLLWELGNELWGEWNVGWPTRQQIAARTLAFGQAVRKVDPSARLIATGGDPDWFHDWNALQLTNPPGTFDDLSAHFVVTNRETRLAHPSLEFVTEAALALPVEMGRRVRDAQRQIDDRPGYTSRAHIAFTEWLFIGDAPGVPSYRNMGGALDTAGMLNMLLRNADVVPISDMTGLLEFAGIWKVRSQVYGAPGYYAFRMYSTSHPVTPVAVENDGGTYSVKNGVTRLPDIQDVPYLDVTAALDRSGDTLMLYCVNRSLDVDITSTIAVNGFAAADEGDVQTLQSASLSDENDEDEPERIVPVATRERVQENNVKHVFPRASVTVIRLHRRSSSK